MIFLPLVIPMQHNETQHQRFTRTNQVGTNVAFFSKVPPFFAIRYSIYP
jgi:hypothetical protein